MNVARICLLLLLLGSIRVVLTGAGNEGLLIAIVGFAGVLGLLDRRLHLCNRTATREGTSVAGLPEDADE